MSVKRYREHCPQLEQGAWVDAQALVVGQVHLAQDVSVWPMAVLRGDVGAIRVGARSNIQDGAVVHVTHASEYTPEGRDTHIGAEVTVGHGAVIHACTIGDRVLVGMNATVLDGALVEDDVLIAAGSLVAQGKRLASGWLYAGNPAKPVRALSEQERAFLRYSATHYVTLAQDYQNHTQVM